MGFTWDAADQQGNPHGPGSVQAYGGEGNTGGGTTPPGGTPPAGTTPPASTPGTSTLFDAVRNMLKTALGHDPTDAQVHQWADGKSPSDLATIQQQIYATDEAKAYGASQTTKGNTQAGYDNKPDYVDLTDPVQKAVYDAFHKKGMQPRDQQDFQYWVDHIKNSQGGWSDPKNQQYWLDRMDQSQGGVGDYQERPEAGAGAGPSYLDPFTETFNFDKFQAPTGANEQNDPGYQARLKAGQEALDRSAAAKGTLLTGTQTQALANYGQDYASNEYEKVYGRALNDYQTNLNAALQGYNTRKATFYSNQDNPFSKLLAQESLDSNNQNYLSGLGLGYANLFANTSMNGANAYTNYLTQGANAGAAGQVGSGNAYSSLFGNLGNNALAAYYMSQYGKRN